MPVPMSDLWVGSGSPPAEGFTAPGGCVRPYRLQTLEENDAVPLLVPVGLRGEGRRRRRGGETEGGICVVCVRVCACVSYQTGTPSLG